MCGVKEAVSREVCTAALWVHTEFLFQFSPIFQFRSNMFQIDILGGGRLNHLSE